MIAVNKLLRFYFITDDTSAALDAKKQVRIALEAGATAVQYRNKRFGLHHYREVCAIRDLCHRKSVPLIINDNVLLAKAVGADGVHLGQDDDSPQMARGILGPCALIGLTAANRKEIAHNELMSCDYIGSGPVFGTATKADAKPTLTLAGLRDAVEQSPLPVVAIGGITAQNAQDCFLQGAAGVAVISAVTRGLDPMRSARELAAVCLKQTPLKEEQHD